MENNHITRLKFFRYYHFDYLDIVFLLNTMNSFSVSLKKIY